MPGKDRPTMSHCDSHPAQPPLTVLRSDGSQAHSHEHDHDYQHRTDECSSSCLECPNLQAEDLMDLTMREVFGI